MGGFVVVQAIMAGLHFSIGRHGFVIWIQPPDLAAGIGIVRWHLTTWWQVAR